MTALDVAEWLFGFAAYFCLVATVLGLCSGCAGTVSHEGIRRDRVRRA